MTTLKEDQKDQQKRLTRDEFLEHTGEIENHALQYYDLCHKLINDLFDPKYRDENYTVWVQVVRDSAKNQLEEIEKGFKYHD